VGRRTIREREGTVWAFATELRGMTRTKSTLYATGNYAER